MTKIYCKCENVEVRGIEQKTSKKGNTYFILHCENLDGSPFSVYLPSIIPVNDIKRGDHIDLDCVYTGGKFPKLEVLGVVNYGK